VGLGSGPSRGAAAGRPAGVPVGWWVLAALPVLCVVSYPIVALGRHMPLGAAAAMLVVLAAMAAAAYGVRWEGRMWSLRGACLAALWANLAVGATAWLGDGADGYRVAGLLVVTTLGMAFASHFLVWLAADALPEAMPARAGWEALRGRRRASLVERAGLAVVLLLGLLVLGLGAVWHRGEDWAPAPVYWLVALAVSAFVLMAAERLRHLVQSARHGNLLLAGQAREKWIVVGILAAIAAALLAAAVPWASPAAEDTLREAGRGTEEAAGAMGALAEAVGERTRALAAGAATAYQTAPKVISLLWLLLILLLLAVVLAWLFGRSRAARWLLAKVAALLAWLLERWRRLTAWVTRLLRGRGEAASEEVEEEEELDFPDPLFDVFEDQEALSRLSAREIAIRTYHLMLNFADMVGRGRGPGQTPFEYGRNLARAIPAAEQAVMALTWGYASAMYGGEESKLPPATALRESWHRVAAALTAGLSEEDLELRRRAYLAARMGRR